MLPWAEPRNRVPTLGDSFFDLRKSAQSIVKNVNVTECPDDEELFSLALGEPVAARKALLEEHIRGCDTCREVLSETLLSLDEGENDESDDLPRLERYELREVIGSGGAGIVYLAFDPTLHREVAIKLLRPGNASSPLIRRRLLREARAMAKLSHPNVVTAYDVGESDLGVFIVLEYHAGGSLSDWLKGKRSFAQRLERIIGAGRGLIAAHDQGIIHRDFKPQNVLIGSHGRTCVTDFGLATFDTTHQGVRFRMDSTVGEATQTRGVMGTPSYMAPEVMAGEKADPFADQFSFCVTAYLALNGRHPFGATSGSSLAELITRIRGGVYEPCDADIPPHIAAALARGLSPSPGDRFAKMGDLLDALAETKARMPLWAILSAGAAALLGLTLLAVLLPEPKRIESNETTPEPPVLSLDPPPPVDEARAPTVDDSEAPPSSEVIELGKESAQQSAADPASPPLAPRPQTRVKKTKASPKKKLEKSQTRYEDQLRSPF